MSSTERSVLPPSSPPGRWGRRVLTGVLVAAALLGGAGGGLWLWRLPLAGWVATRAAAAAGLGPAQLTIERLDFSGLRVRDLRLGDAGPLVVGQVDATYTLEMLRRRAIDTLTLDGVQAVGEVTAEGLRIGDLSVPLGGGGGGGLPVLPLRVLALTRAEIVADTVWGPVTAAGGLRIERGAGAIALAIDGTVAARGGVARIQADGSVRDAAGGLAGALDLTVAGGVRDIAGEVRGRVEVTRAGDGTVSASLTIADGSARFADGRIDGVAGTVGYARAPRAKPTASAAITYSGVDAFGQVLEPGRLSLSLDGDDVRAEATLVAPGVRGTASAIGSLEDLARPLEIDLRGFVEAARLLPLLPVPAGTAATGQIDFAIAGTVEPQPLIRGGGQPGGQGGAAPIETLGALSASVRLAGSVGMDLGAVSVPGWLDAGSLAGSFALTVGDGALELLARNSVAVAGTFDAARAATVPPVLRPLLAGPVAITLAADGATPLSLRVSQSGSGLAVAGAASLRLTAGPAVVTAAFDANSVLDAAYRPETIDVPFLVATVDGLAVGDLAVSADTLLTDVAATPDDVAGRIALTVSAAKAVGPLRFDGAAIDLDGGFVLKDGRLVVEPDVGSRAGLGTLALADGVRLLEPVSIGFGGRGNVLRVELASRAFDYRLALAPFTVALAPRPDGGTMRLNLPDLAVEGTRDSAVAVLGDAGLSATRPPLASDGISGTVTWAGQGVVAALEIARLEHTAEVPWVAPLAGSLALEWADDAVAFTAAVAADGLALNARGRHDLVGRAGVADVELRSLEFAVDGRQPADLVPRLGAVLERVEGRLAAGGRIDWGDGAIGGDLDVSLAGVGFAAGSAVVSGLNGDLTLSGLTPPVTPPDQHLTADIGVGRLAPSPLDLRFQLRPDGQVQISAATLTFAGGTVRTADVTFDPVRRAGDLVVVFDGVDMATLAALIALPGLEATGRLDGTLPLQIRGGKVAVAAGQLIARGPGRLSYTGQDAFERLAARADTVGLAMQALSDFRYDSLNIDIDKALAGPGAAVLHVEGANPAVLEGYPFVFNIDLSTDFDRLVALILDGLDRSSALARFAVDQARQ